HRIGTVERVEACAGRPSIRLISGRGWLDGVENAYLYWDQPMRKDELNWLIITLRRALGLIPRVESGAQPGGDTSFSPDNRGAVVGGGISNRVASPISRGT